MRILEASVIMFELQFYLRSNDKLGKWTNKGCSHATLLFVKPACSAQVISKKKRAGVTVCGTTEIPGRPLQNSRIWTQNAVFLEQFRPFLVQYVKKARDFGVTAPILQFSGLNCSKLV